MTPREYPQIIKYMGSKAKIIGDVTQGITKVWKKGTPICDLFSGACSLSGALGNQALIISNDIQEYSKALASPYLFRVSKQLQSLPAEEIINFAQEHIKAVQKEHADIKDLEYSNKLNLIDFNKLDAKNRNLINQDWKETYIFFLKTYAGTWWSAEQALWIDALRYSADKLLRDKKITNNDYSFILSCIMHAMAYCSQGTGHFAQYRDAKDSSSLDDIKKYRAKDLSLLFKNKYKSLINWNLQQTFKDGHRCDSLDYTKCLQTVQNATVYADPPYAFVHYSRFYHALETLVKYDSPEIQKREGAFVKGRYRTERHQSPFSIKTQVVPAFTSLFEGIRNGGNNLVLSYSNTGLLCLNELKALARDTLGHEYEVTDDDYQHTHMTMGRKADRDRQIVESLIIAEKK